MNGASSSNVRGPTGFRREDDRVEEGRGRLPGFAIAALVVLAVVVLSVLAGRDRPGSRVEDSSRGGAATGEVSPRAR